MKVMVLLIAAGLALFLAVPLAGCQGKDSGEQSEPAAQATTDAHFQTTCPVMGGEIDKKYYADHEGKRVYFCCASCIDEFNKEPEKYIKALTDQGVVLEDAPAK